MDQNYYIVLGVSHTATSQEIKLAYKRLALQYHPDRNPGNVRAEEQFKLVNTAYQTLSNPSKRARYDLKLQYISEQRRVAQPQTYYDPRYNHTREPAGVSERYYRKRPVMQDQRFSKRDTYITVAFIACLLLFSLLLKVVMDYIAGEDKYKTALTYIADGKYSSAHSLLTDAIHFRPKHADAYLTRASIELNVFEDYQDALQDINQAIALEENVPAETYYMRGKCYQKLAQFKLAEQDLTRALQLDSNLYAAHLERGEVRLFYLRNYRAAIADFTTFLKHSHSGESWSKALTFRGFGYYKLGDYTLSEADYRRVLDVDDSNGRVYYLLGRTELEQQFQDSACVHFNNAYRLGYTAAMLELRANCP